MWFFFLSFLLVNSNKKRRKRNFSAFLPTDELDKKNLQYTKPKVNIVCLVSQVNSRWWLAENQQKQFMKFSSNVTITTSSFSSSFFSSNSVEIIYMKKKKRNATVLPINLQGTYNTLTIFLQRHPNCPIIESPIINLSWPFPPPLPQYLMELPLFLLIFSDLICLV